MAHERGVRTEPLDELGHLGGGERVGARPGSEHHGLAGGERVRLVEHAPIGPIAGVRIEGVLDAHGPGAERGECRLDLLARGARAREGVARTVEGADGQDQERADRAARQRSRESGQSVRRPDEQEREDGQE